MSRTYRSVVCCETHNVIFDISNKTILSINIEGRPPAKFTLEVPSVLTDEKGRKHTINQIGKNAFSRFAPSKINHLIIHDGITSLEDEAFCSTIINRVTLPETITHISTRCFACSHLKRINCSSLQLFLITKKIGENAHKHLTFLFGHGIM